MADDRDFKLEQEELDEQLLEARDKYLAKAVPFGRAFVINLVENDIVYYNDIAHRIIGGVLVPM